MAREKFSAKQSQKIVLTAHGAGHGKPLSYKYLNELRAWTRIERQRSMSEDTHVINSVSSAMRPPGKYSFKWDGKDDFGNPVKEGKYTVMIEAVREHGSYQLMHQEMDFNGSPTQVQLPGAVEIASATLDYRKVVR